MYSPNHVTTQRTYRPGRPLSTRSLLVIAFALTAIAPALAAERPGTSASEEKEEKVALQVWTIRATRANEEISKELEPLAELLKKTFKFTGYKLVGKETPTVEIKKTHESKLTGKFAGKITPTKRAGGKVTLHIHITEDGKDKLDTTVSLAAGKFQLLGGWKLDGDDVLIVAVSAK